MLSQPKYSCFHHILENGKTAGHIAVGNLGQLLFTPSLNTNDGNIPQPFFTFRVQDNGGAGIVTGPNGNITFANNNPRAYEPDIAPKAINIIADLVEDGTLSEARIDESVARIEAFKKRLPR